MNIICEILNLQAGNIIRMSTPEIPFETSRNFLILANCQKFHLLIFQGNYFEYISNKNDEQEES
jgi:hypothetical protein